MRTIKIYLEFEIPEALWRELEKKLKDKAKIRKVQDGYKIKVKQTIGDLLRIRLWTMVLQMIDKVSKIR